MTNEQDKWLANLKAGDDVIVAGGWSGNALRTVERASPTLITVAGIRYRRNSGWPTGTGYRRTFLQIPTQDGREAAEKSELQQRLSNVKWPQLSLDALRTVDEIVRSATQKVAS